MFLTLARIVTALSVNLLVSSWRSSWIILGSRDSMYSLQWGSLHSSRGFYGLYNPSQVLFSLVLKNRFFTTFKERVLCARRTIANFLTRQVLVYLSVPALQVSGQFWRAPRSAVGHLPFIWLDTHIFFVFFVAYFANHNVVLITHYCWVKPEILPHWINRFPDFM